MATYQVRHLHCLRCDEPVRVRNLIEDAVEIPSSCPECNGSLVDIGRLDLTVPREVSGQERQSWIDFILGSDPGGRHHRP